MRFSELMSLVCYLSYFSENEIGGVIPEIIFRIVHLEFYIDHLTSFIWKEARGVTLDFLESLVRFGVFYWSVINIVLEIIIVA